MKLEFDSTDELQEFLDWSLRYGASWAAVQRGSTTNLPKIDPDLLNTAARTETKTYTDGTTVTGPGPLPEQAPAQQDATSAQGEVAFDTPPAANEPTKRKRRTKAEIEADAAVEAEARKTAEAIEAAGNVQNFRGTAQPEGTVFDDKGRNPFEQPAATPSAETGAPEAEGDVPEQAVTPFQHLTRAREFIAKHGMPKYNESFVKAGLDPNVMAYTAEQRAQHLDALTALEQA